MELFPILTEEIDLFVVQTKLIGGLVKRGFRKEDIVIFNLGIEEIERRPYNKNQADQVYPLDRHKKQRQKLVGCACGAFLQL